MQEEFGNKRKSSLFLASLSSECTEQELHHIFAVYGEIFDIKIMKSNSVNKSLTYGFVNYITVKAATQAKKELNGFVLHGEPLRLGWALTKGGDGFQSRSSYRKENTKITTAQVHVSYLTEQMEELVTHKTLHKIFSIYGNVLDVTLILAKVVTDELPNRQCGHGFIHYDISKEGIESAFNATKSLTRKVVEGIELDCELSHQVRGYLLRGEALRQDPDTGEETLLHDKLTHLNSFNSLDGLVDAAATAGDEEDNSSVSTKGTARTYNSSAQHQHHIQHQPVRRSVQGYNNRVGGWQQQPSQRGQQRPNQQQPQQQTQQHNQAYTSQYQQPGRRPPALQVPPPQSQQGGVVQSGPSVYSPGRGMTATGTQSPPPQWTTQNPPSPVYYYPQVPLPLSPAVAAARGIAPFGYANYQQQMQLQLQMQQAQQVQSQSASPQPAVGQVPMLMDPAQLQHQQLQQQQIAHMQNVMAGEQAYLQRQHAIHAQYSMTQPGAAHTAGAQSPQLTPPMVYRAPSDSSPREQYAVPQHKHIPYRGMNVAISPYNQPVQQQQHQVFGAEHAQAGTQVQVQTPTYNQQSYYTQQQALQAPQGAQIQHQNSYDSVESYSSVVTVQPQYTSPLSRQNTPPPQPSAIQIQLTAIQQQLQYNQLQQMQMHIYNTYPQQLLPPPQYTTSSTQLQQVQLQGSQSVAYDANGVSTSTSVTLSPSPQQSVRSLISLPPNTNVNINNNAVISTYQNTISPQQQYFNTQPYNTINTNNTNNTQNNNITSPVRHPNAHYTPSHTQHGAQQTTQIHTTNNNTNNTNSNNNITNHNINNAQQTPLMKQGLGYKRYTPNTVTSSITPPLNRVNSNNSSENSTTNNNNHNYNTNTNPNNDNNTNTEQCINSSDRDTTLSTSNVVATPQVQHTNEVNTDNTSELEQRLQNTNI